MNANVTETLAQYIAQAKYDDFPKEIVHKAKQLILDNIGCAFGGYVTDNGKVLTSFARAIGGKAESTLIGDGARVSCMVAAGVNAQMANILDFDDESIVGHPGSAIVQTAISLGERLGASGKEVIEATVVGYESVGRIAGGAPTHTPRLRATPNAAPISHHVFGSAVAAAKILGLDVPQTKHAIGVAGAAAPTFNLRRLTDRPASPTKCCNLWNCLTGISAAFLAQEGFGGPVDYLDGPKGYWSLFSDEVDFAAMTAELGKRYLTAEVRTKPWPTCGLNHSSVQLVSSIVKDEGIGPEDIEEITIKANSIHAGHPFTGQRPIEMWDAIFSAPWALAMAVLGHEPGPDWYTGEKFNDPVILNLAAKVKIEVWPEADRIKKERGIRKQSPVEIELKAKGRTYVRGMDGAKGDMDNPLTDDEYKGKFRSLANRCLNSAQVEEIIKTAFKLEDARNVAGLTSLLKPTNAKSATGN